MIAQEPYRVQLSVPWSPKSGAMSGSWCVKASLVLGEADSLVHSPTVDPFGSFLCGGARAHTHP